MRGRLLLLSVGGLAGYAAVQVGITKNQRADEFALENDEQAKF